MWFRLWKLWPGTVTEINHTVCTVFDLFKECPFYVLCAVMLRDMLLLCCCQDVESKRWHERGNPGVTQRARAEKIIRMLLNKKCFWTFSAVKKSCSQWTEHTVLAFQSLYCRHITTKAGTQTIFSSLNPLYQLQLSACAMSFIMWFYVSWFNNLWRLSACAMSPVMWSYVSCSSCWVSAYIYSMSYCAWCCLTLPSFFLPCLAACSLFPVLFFLIYSICCVLLAFWLTLAHLQWHWLKVHYATFLQSCKQTKRQSSWYMKFGANMTFRCTLKPFVFVNIREKQACILRCSF